MFLYVLKCVKIENKNVCLSKHSKVKHTFLFSHKTSIFHTFNQQKTMKLFLHMLQKDVDSKTTYCYSYFIETQIKEKQHGT
jgi:hypothetical protein